MLKNLDELFSRRPFLLIDREEDLPGVVDALGQEIIIGVDTENDSLFSYYPRMCLLQISTLSMDYLIDPLLLPDISPLAPIFESGDIEKVFHDAKFDIHHLVKEYNFKVRRIYDTRIASGWTGSQKLGLDSISAEFLGVEISKSMQKVNWAIRPLDRGQIDYARKDSSILLPLREATLKRLKALGREEICGEEFLFLSEFREPSPYEKLFHPRDFLNIEGSRKLGREKRRVLQELYIFRENMSKKLNISPSKLMSNNDLLKIVGRKIDRREDLFKIKRFSKEFIEGVGDELIEAVQRGKNLEMFHLKPYNTPGKSRRRYADNHTPSFESMRGKDLALRLKKWRKEKSALFGVKADFIMSPQTIDAIVKNMPTTIEEFKSIDLLRKWQWERWGAELQEITNNHSETLEEEDLNGIEGSF